MTSTNSREEIAERVWIEISFMQRRFYVGELEGEVISSTAFGVACEEIVSDEPDQGSTKGRPKHGPCPGPRTLNSGAHSVNRSKPKDVLCLTRGETWRRCPTFSD